MKKCKRHLTETNTSTLKRCSQCRVADVKVKTKTNKKKDGGSK
jgi:hypothetical protein